MKVVGFLWCGMVTEEGGEALVKSGLCLSGVHAGVDWAGGGLRARWGVVKYGGLDDVLKSGGEVDGDGGGGRTRSHGGSLNHYTDTEQTLKHTNALLTLKHFFTKISLEHLFTLIEDFGNTQHTNQQMHKIYLYT